MSRPDVVAAFDFDGTLSPRDNFVPFLRRFAGTSATVAAFATGALRLAKRGRESWSRNHMKAEILEQLAGGRDATDLDDTARTFAADVIARHLRGEAVALADWHRDQGHRLVIVSASLATYLRPIAEHLRFDAVLATELEVGDDGRLTGRMRRRERARPREGAPPRRVDRRRTRRRNTVRVGVRRQLGRQGALGTRRPGRPARPSCAPGHRLTARSRYRTDAGPLVG